MILHEKIAAQLPEWRERVKKLVKEHADVVVDQVTIGQIYGGMRDVKVMVTDISYVDPAEGIRFRGYSIPEVLSKLPKPGGAEMPYVGGLYYLLLVGEIPTQEQACAVEAEWARRSTIPQYVYETLRAMPKETHPMTLFTLAVQSLQTQSEFARRYHEGMRKEEYWGPMLEDSLNLTAKLPVIAAFIYNLKYNGGEIPQVDPSLDWGANFAQMMGVKDKGYEDLARLYFILHSDHESGNVSAHATHLVGSSLADAYYAFSAGLNGLAGPLHGLANQECLGWLIGVREPVWRRADQRAITQICLGDARKRQGHPRLRARCAARPGSALYGADEVCQRTVSGRYAGANCRHGLRGCAAGAQGAGQGQESGPKRGCHLRHIAVSLWCA